MPTGLLQQLSRVTTGKLNTVNDAAPGATVASPTGLPRYGGHLGALAALGKNEVKYDPAIGTLYGGLYQYVQTKTGSSAAPARGLVAFWDDPLNFVVTPDAPAGTSRIAGIYLSAPTKGNYCWIQTAGLASVKYASSITKATPAAGDLVLVKASDNVGEILADATGLTSVEVRSVLGIAHETPVANSVKLVQLLERFLNI